MSPFCGVSTWAGAGPLKMVDLRAAFEGMGFRNTRTVLASGNVVFDAVPAGGAPDEADAVPVTGGPPTASRPPSAGGQEELAALGGRIEADLQPRSLATRSRSPSAEWRTSSTWSPPLRSEGSRSPQRAGSTSPFSRTRSRTGTRLAPTGGNPTSRSFRSRPGKCSAPSRSRPGGGRRSSWLS